MGTITLVETAAAFKQADYSPVSNDENGLGIKV